MHDTLSPIDELNNRVVNCFCFPRNPIWFKKTNENIKTLKVIKDPDRKANMFEMRNVTKASLPLESRIAKAT